MHQILIYSDSLTWGIIPNTRNRLPFDERWPGVLENILSDSGHTAIFLILTIELARASTKYTMFSALLGSSLLDRRLSFLLDSFAMLKVVSCHKIEFVEL